MTPLLFQPSGGGVTFGSSISTTGTPPFSSFTLQGPGIYQIHLSGGFSGWNLTDGNPGDVLQIQPFLGGSQVGDALGILPPVAGGDRLISVSGANTPLGFGVTIAGGAGILTYTGNVGFCELVITRLQ